MRDDPVSRARDTGGAIAKAVAGRKHLGETQRGVDSPVDAPDDVGRTVGWGTAAIDVAQGHCATAIAVGSTTAKRAFGLDYRAALFVLGGPIDVHRPAGRRVATTVEVPQ